jgi:predicted nucleic acid-binding protein
MPDKMQKSKIMVDTSSWINVFRVDLTSYLIENFYVLVTSKVNEEILEGKGFGEDAKLFVKLSTEGNIQIVKPKTIQEEIKHEISVSSGEIEIIAYAMERGDCIVLIDDSKVYQVMDRFNLKYISSANIIIDACLTGKINKDEAYRLLEILRKVLKGEVIDKAKAVLKDDGNKAKRGI